jgi:hypothetical protein
MTPHCSASTDGTAIAAGVSRVIWSPNNAVPIPMPNHPSEDEAAKEARAAIDHILDGEPAPKL